MKTYEKCATRPDPIERPVARASARQARRTRSATFLAILPPIVTSMASSACSTEASAQWLLGAKAGTMQVEFDDATVDDDPLNAGFLIGRRFDALPGSPALALEITRSVSSGSVIEADLNVDTHGLYVAMRTPGPLYVQGRLGYMFASLDGELAEPENGETFGVALGWQRRSWSVELGYTSIDDDVSFLSAGIVHRLGR